MAEVLFARHDEIAAHGIRDELKRRGNNVTFVMKHDEAIALLRERGFDAVITGLAFGSMQVGGLVNVFQRGVDVVNAARMAGCQKIALTTSTPEFIKRYAPGANLDGVEVLDVSLGFRNGGLRQVLDKWGM